MLLESDVFVLCSLWEGLPGSVLEAMTAGVAVIGTSVNGTRELIDHGRTGLLAIRTRWRRRCGRWRPILSRERG